MHTGESLVDELTKRVRGQRDPRRRCMNARTQGCERWVDTAPHDVPVGTDHDDRPWPRDPVGTPYAPGPVRREVRAGPNTHRPGELHDRTGRPASIDDDRRHSQPRRPDRLGRDRADPPEVGGTRAAGRGDERQDDAVAAERRRRHDLPLPRKRELRSDRADRNARRSSLVTAPTITARHGERHTDDAAHGDQRGQRCERASHGSLRMIHASLAGHR